jgi:hypothetical protein
VNVYSASKLIQPVDTTRAEQPGGISPAVHSVLAVFSSKEPRPNRKPAGDGVSTYLALTFGTLLSSQGTDASFVLTRETLSWLSSGRFPSVLRFRLYQIVFLIRFPVGRVAFRPLGLPAVLTLSEPFGVRLPVNRACLRDRWAVPTSQTLADSPGEPQIEVPDPSRAQRKFEFGHAEFDPVGRSCWWFVCRLCGGGAAEEPLRLCGNPKNSTDRAGDCQAPRVKIF